MPTLSKSGLADLIYHTLKDTSTSVGLCTKTRQLFERSGTCSYRTVAIIACRALDVELDSDAGKNLSGGAETPHLGNQFNCRGCARFLTISTSHQH